MNLDINIGDVVLGGRFKNKRIVVKSIGEDDLGQPIFNKGRKLLSVRIEKKLPEGMWSSKTLAQKYKEKDMNKKAYLQEVYDSALNDELEKISERNSSGGMSRKNRIALAKKQDNQGRTAEAVYNFRTAVSGRKVSPADSSRQVRKIKSSFGG